jgi:hypothetical protein
MRMPACRTMFSRTTMASSISSPMASESPISVSTFSVKFSPRITMNVLITDTGSARPVMTVLRQLFRNRNTISTVSRPPSSSVTCTSSTESRMKIERSTTVRRKLDFQ